MQGCTWYDTVNLSAKHAKYFLLLFLCTKPLLAYLMQYFKIYFYTVSALKVTRALDWNGSDIFWLLLIW